MGSGKDPKVTFVVPCYNLAHLLGECVRSILEQSHGDLEVLILDDCSPDDTPLVARSFSDPRVHHIRNETNLRHLANYNKGIGLARGKYVWLISADDKLRRPYVLERFVDLLERNPSAGYVFSPAMRFKGGEDTGVYGWREGSDGVIRGRTFFRHLLRGNGVPAAAGLVRKECYERYGSFPLDMPFAGDWYMWCLFALHSDVGFLAEPMVGWRDHELNMTKYFKEKQALLVKDEFRVLWRVRGLVEAERDAELLEASDEALADYYRFRAVSRHEGEDGIGLTIEDLEASLAEHVAGAPKTLPGRIRSRVFAALGDLEHDRGRYGEAKGWYARAVRERPGALRPLAKLGLARLGALGRGIRRLSSLARPPAAARAAGPASPEGAASAARK